MNSTREREWCFGFLSPSHSANINAETMSFVLQILYAVMMVAIPLVNV